MQPHHLRRQLGAAIIAVRAESMILTPRPAVFHILVIDTNRADKDRAFETGNPMHLKQIYRALNIDPCGE